MFQDNFLLHFLFNLLRLLFISFGSMSQNFSSLSHTKTLCISIYSFHFYSFIYTCSQPFISFNLKYSQTKNDVIYLQPFHDIYITPTLLYHLILTRISRLWVYDKGKGLHFLFSDGSLRFWCWNWTLWILWRLWFALSLWVFESLVWKSHKCIFF